MCIGYEDRAILSWRNYYLDDDNVLRVDRVEFIVGLGADVLESELISALREDALLGVARSVMRIQELTQKRLLDFGMRIHIKTFLICSKNAAYMVYE